MTALADGRRSGTQDSEEVKLLHQQIFLTLYDEFTPGDYERFRIMVRAYLGDGEIAACKDIAQLLQKLEATRIISIGEYDKLIGILSRAGLEKAAKAVNCLVAQIEQKRSIPKRSADYITIWLHTLTGKKLTVLADRNATVYALKYLLTRLEGIPPDQSTLLVGSLELKDNFTLADYDVSDETSVHLLLRHRGGEVVHMVAQMGIEVTSPALTLKCQKVIKFFDLDGDGVVTTKDMESIARYISEKTAAGPEEAEVTRAAWLSWGIRWFPSDQSTLEGIHGDGDCYVDLFDSLDMNKDGHISYDELQLFYAAVGVTDQDLAKNVFRAIDRNESGQLRKRAFVEAFRRYWTSDEDFIFKKSAVNSSKPS